MRVISKKILNEYCVANPAATIPLNDWYDTVKKADW